MFTRVEVQNFRSLRDVSVNLSNFHVLVGANGSGKTTFLDVFAFMGDMLRLGVNEAVQMRSNKFEELTFGLGGGVIKFAFEAQFPKSILPKLDSFEFDSVRYEISVFKNVMTRGIGIGQERCFLFDSQRPRKYLEYDPSPESITKYWISNRFDPHDRLVIDRESEGVLILTNETKGKAVGAIRFQLEESSIALANVPEDLQKFPITTWLKYQFNKFLQPIQISSDSINKASKEGRPNIVNPDGSNLPWLIDSLKKKYPDRYKRWLQHLRVALPEIKSINTVAREDYGDKFLKIKYQEGHEVKQWMVSDGTLRILLLTLIPYDLDLQGLFLIEEPETGIYPQAIETVMDALRFIYAGQAFITTHATGVVNSVKKKDLLLFEKNEQGETKITTMEDNALLRDWKGALSSAAFFSEGIAG